MINLNSYLDVARDRLMCLVEENARRYGVGNRTMRKQFSIALLFKLCEVDEALKTKLDAERNRMARDGCSALQSAKGETVAEQADNNVAGLALDLFVMVVGWLRHEGFRDAERVIKSYLDAPERPRRAQCEDKRK